MDFSSINVMDLVMEYGPTLLLAIVTLIVGFWIIGWVVNLVSNLMKKNGIDDTIRPFLTSLVSVGLKLMLLLSVAGMFGVETASFIAIFGAMAFAIGMALQGSLGHFASGVMLLIFKPYKVGDLVEIGGGQTGSVEEVAVFNTVLRTLDNKKIIVPNGVVTSNVITNISGQGTAGVELEFGIGYDDDIDKAKAIILQVAKECPYILDDPAPGVVVGSLGESSVNLNTRPFCKSENYWNANFYMLENVKKAFDKNGISIPFPQVDMHSKS